MKTPKLVALVLFLLPVLLGTYGALYSKDSATSKLEPIRAGAGTSELWVCPMHAEILQDHPGSCPVCGMDLVPTDGGHVHAEPGVAVDTATLQKLGVRLAEATRQALSRDIQTFGEVVVDESKILNITPKIDGWIRRMHVRASGEPVQAGQPIYDIYAPELIQRQREYIELLQRRDSLLRSMTNISGQNAQALASLARERLRLRDRFLYADLSRGQLDELDAKRRALDVVPIQATMSGFALEVGAREGDYVTPQTTLLSIVDTGTVWIDVALYPDQQAWAKEGDTVQLQLSTPRKKKVRAALRFASPVATGAARTRIARFALDNTGLGLTPGTLVDAVLSTTPREVLALPRSAVFRSGQGDTVMLSRGDGRFVPVGVETGLETTNLVEITAGLQEGARVAVNGQFLLDAAASMNATRQRLQGGDAE
ncbi:MAG: efflux RND transporter periplasmic adaptor subunit [Thiohalobacteraceae bacterium]